VEGTFAAMVRDYLLQHADESGFAIHAYCIMPDHAHVLVEGDRATADLKGFVARWKQDTGFAFRSSTGRRLWQPGFFDRVLREQESSRVVARYIIENPVRARLVNAVNEYPFAWCRWVKDPSFWD
jgi:putative transposase